MDKGRRSFLKRTAAFLGIVYVNPMAVIPEYAPAINQLVSPHEIVKEALFALEENMVFSLTNFSKTIIEPAMNKLCDRIDQNIADTATQNLIIQFKRSVKNGS